MTNVHEAITAHSKKQHQIVKEFVLLEDERERAIEEAVAKCERHEPFSTDRINQVTAKMNDLAKKASFRRDGLSQRKWSKNTSAEKCARIDMVDPSESRFRPSCKT